MPNNFKPLMILIAGPYRCGAHDALKLIAENVRVMNRIALRLLRAGHIPVVGDDVFNEIFHPVAHLLAPRCDACLRVGGPSQGANGMVKLAESLGQQVFF